jgi:single-stranded DNA-binding protein
MIDGLIAGKLYGTATSRTGQSGKTFVTAKVRAAAGDGESLFVNVIAFDDKAKDALLALDDGDSVSLAGTLTPKVWTDKQGVTKPVLDMVAHAVLTAYHVKRKRAAVQRDPAHGNDRQQMGDAEQADRMDGGAVADFDDDL